MYPIFAMVEDENPPAYEPVSLNDDTASFSAEDSERQVGSAPAVIGDKPVTSSIRAINRILKANGGFKANLRGAVCLFAQTVLVAFFSGIFSASLGSFFTPVATLLTSLALVQLSTAWVHIVLTPHSSLPFYRRLPPFKRTFDATWKPVALLWVAMEFIRWVPPVMAAFMGVYIPGIWAFGTVPDSPAGPWEMFWKVLVINCVSFIASIYVTLPPQIILVRVQASLLPEDQTTVIPFDRSFEGTVEPAVVGGKGYATIKDAWSTFSKTAWRRLLILIAKVTAISFAFFLSTGLVMGLQFTIIGKFSHERS